jgi:hypothetical protein
MAVGFFEKDTGSSEINSLIVWYSHEVNEFLCDKNKTLRFLYEVDR